MASPEPVRVGKRGTIVLPAELRRRYGIEEGSVVLMEEREDGILIRRGAVLPVEIYTPARRAEFLLTNATDVAEYRWAVREVRKMGLDPKSVPHEPPPGD
jgi:AbrB family looped-hinge helix DNA binding protein